MAILKRATVRNFRNVGFKVIDLESNNIIRGQNMSGKTNTLNAIHWAFTGATLEGSVDNRGNFPIVDLGVETPTISVKLEFEDFSFERVCELANGTPTVSVIFDGEKATTIKNGEARLHAKLGLSDFILTQPKNFDIVKFLLNPLYFDGVAAKDLRKLFYYLSNTNFNEIADRQNKSVSEMLYRYQIYEPYKLSEEIDKKKKSIKKDIDACKVARKYFPIVEEEATKLEKEKTKELKEVESDEALAQKYALCVSKKVNDFYKRAMGIEVCLLEKGVGEDVYKDVCYPILPRTGLPFAFGSYAERSFVGMLFIQEVCLKFNIKPLPILLDNMESLDEHSLKRVNSLNAQYIGALVE